jgi:hypothetical protein
MRNIPNEDMLSGLIPTTDIKDPSAPEGPHPNEVGATPGAYRRIENAINRSISLAVPDTNRK